MGCLFGVSVKYGKRYCYPSQRRIGELLLDYHGVDISNRTLNRDLRLLVDGGYIKRVRRTKRVIGCGKQFSSTLYKFKARAYIWLNSMAKWSERVLRFCRLPKMADNKSMRGNEILSKSSTGCGNPVEIIYSEG
jgi:hypothetical protein